MIEPNDIGVSIQDFKWHFEKHPHNIILLYVVKYTRLPNTYFNYMGEKKL